MISWMFIRVELENRINAVHEFRLVQITRFIKKIKLKKSDAFTNWCQEWCQECAKELDFSESFVTSQLDLWMLQRVELEYWISIIYESSQITWFIEKMLLEWFIFDAELISTEWHYCLRAALQQNWVLIASLNHYFPMYRCKAALKCPCHTCLNITCHGVCNIAVCECKRSAKL